MSEEEDKVVKTGDVDVNDLVPCVALCCCIFSLYTELPDCCGSVCENTVLCCLCKLMSCKASKEEGTFCKCINVDFDCIYFKTCCQAKAQAFCIDGRIAFPPTEEIPCLLTCCCFTCCFKNQCLCSVGKDIRGIIEKAEGSKVSPKKSSKKKARDRDEEYEEEDHDDDWVEMTDQKTGKTYYLNKVTNKTQWESPY